MSILSLLTFLPVTLGVRLAVYLKGNRIKVEIALAKGKRLYDKRQAEKEKLLDREAREGMRE